MNDRLDERVHVDRSRHLVPTVPEGGLEATEAGDARQESGLSDSRLLARLVQAGVVVLDEHANLASASPAACGLLGAADEAELRDRWAGIGSQLRVAEWPQELPDGIAHHGRAELATPSGARLVRFEVHAFTRDGLSHRLVLLRDCGRLQPLDRLLLVASEADANRHVLSGLVHAAKGPLNNFGLTLTLLATGIARADPPEPDTLARWLRYVDVLRGEIPRLCDGLDAIQALATPPRPASEACDIATTVQDVVRVLHHDAAMREIGLEANGCEKAVTVSGDPQLLRLALLSLTIAMLDATPADGIVSLRVEPARDGAYGSTIAIATSRGALPVDLVSNVYRLACPAESAHYTVIAARMIIEAQGGDLVVDANGEAPGFRVRIPGARGASQAFESLRRMA